MDLITAPGLLLLTSTRANIDHGGENLQIAEAPALFLAGVGSNDISISMLVRGIRVPNGSDQLGIIVGTSSTNETLRGLLHERNAYVFSENWIGTGFNDSNIVSDLAAFDTGDDIVLMLSRLNGQWALSWDNLTNASPARDGALPMKQLPWLDASNDLYVGVFHANPGSQIQMINRIDRFSVDIVPEPSSLLVWCLAASVASVWCRFRPTAPNGAPGSACCTASSS